MLSIEAVLILIWVHFVADFVCQTDKMGVNKSSSLLWLFAHIFSYTFAVFSCVLFFVLYNSKIHDINFNYDIGLVLFFSLFNGLTHLIIDFVSSKLTKYLYQNNKRHDFFVVIGFDQALHLSILMFSWLWLTTYY